QALQQSLLSLQKILRGPLSTVETISTALWTTVIFYPKARATTLALVWSEFVLLSARERLFNAIQVTHIVVLSSVLLTRSNLKFFSHSFIHALASENLT